MISILKEYPADSQIAIQIGGAINHFMEIKGVLPKSESGTDPYHLEFLGNDIERGCLDIGMVTIENEKRVLSEIVSWKWYDRDHPDENCDILDEIAG